MSYLKLLVAVILISLTGCSKQKQEVLDGEQPVKVMIDDREFLVPKKYIDNPSLSVENPLTFDETGSMIAYFYFPSLAGLSDTDEQQRFGRFNHEVVSMQWYIKSNHYIDAKRKGVNVLDRSSVKIDKNKCQWKSLTCLSLIDLDFFKWVGSYEGFGSFHIRCPIDREDPIFETNQICNLSLDYDPKDIYIESLISSNFIASEDDLPKIMLQMKRFIDEWEVTAKAS